LASDVGACHPVFQVSHRHAPSDYTTQALSSVNAAIRHITSKRALFPNDEAVFKLLYLAVLNASKK